MKTRSETEQRLRAKSRKLEASKIAETTPDRHQRPYIAEAKGDRIASVEVDEAKELKIRVASAAYNSLKSLGVPVHNAHVVDIQVSAKDEVLGRVAIKKASLLVNFDIPYSSPEGRGVRTASIPVSYEDGRLLVGKEFSYQGARFPVTAKALCSISAQKDQPSGDSAFTIVAVLTDSGHEIIGATQSAPAIVASLKTAGFRVAFRNPQDALNIEVSEPFYEVLAGNDIQAAKKIASQWLKPTKKVAQTTETAAPVGADPLKAPASTTPVPSSDELEEFRKQVGELEAKKAELDAAVAAYAEGLAKKEGFDSAAEVHQRIANLQKQVETAAEQLAAPLIQLRDGTLLAKVTSVRLNDPAWKEYLEKLALKSKKLVGYLTRWVELFRTMTVKHSWKEIDHEDIGATFKKQTKQQTKIDDFLGNQQDLAGKAPSYMLDSGTGGINVKKGQAESDSSLVLLSHAAQEIAERSDIEATSAAQLTKEAEDLEKTKEMDEEYPLPSVEKTASKRATTPISAGSLDRRLSETEKIAIQTFQFSSAADGNHWSFHRAAGKKGVTGRELIAQYTAQGFSEAEAYGEVSRKIKAAKKDE